MALSGEIPRAAPGQELRAQRAAPGAEERQRAGAAAAASTRSRRCCATRGYHVAMKGKWHLTKPVDGAALGRGRPRADRARLRLRRVGAARRRRGHEGAQLRRRQRRARAGRAGTRTTRARWRRWLAAGSLPEPFCLVVLARQPPRRARLSRTPTRTGGYAPRGVPRPRRAAAARRIDEDLREKPAVQALSRLGMDNYLGPLTDRRPSRTTSTSTPTCTGSWTRRSAACCARSGRPTTRTRCARARRDRAHLRPRRDGALPRRPAPEDLQRLRGDDPRPARGLEPAPVPAAARERRARLAARRRAHAASGLAGGRATCPQAPRRRGPRAADLRGESARRSATRSCSPTTTTRPAPPCRRRRASPTASAACATSASSTPSTSTRPAGARPEYELYDLQEDPLEMRNLARGPQRARPRAPPRGRERERWPRA